MYALADVPKAYISKELLDWNTNADSLGNDLGPQKKASKNVQMLLSFYIKNFSNIVNGHLPNLKHSERESTRLHSILFEGGVGSGKTFIASVVVKEAIKLNMNAKYFDWSELCQTLGDFNNKEEIESIVEKFKTFDLVVVDGQHKALMAYLGGGEDAEIPCMIYVHDENMSLPECVAVEAELFSELNTTRKNTSTLDKVRAGLSFNDDDAVEFEKNFIAIGVKAEGIGYEDGPEVNGFAKAVESIKKWKIENTRKAVDHLVPIYNHVWNLDYIDGSMIGALAAVFNLINAVGKGEKANGLRNYIRTNMSTISRSDWTKDSRGNSDIIIARRIITKYNDAVKQGFVKGAAIGPDVLANNGLKDSDSI
jgi:hypothetical protein